MNKKNKLGKFTIGTLSLVGMFGIVAPVIVDIWDTQDNSFASGTKKYISKLEKSNFVPQQITTLAELETYLPGISTGRNIELLNGEVIGYSGNNPKMVNGGNIANVKMNEVSNGDFNLSVEVLPGVFEYMVAYASTNPADAEGMYVNQPVEFDLIEIWFHKGDLLFIPKQNSPSNRPQDYVEGQYYDIDVAASDQQYVNIDYTTTFPTELELDNWNFKVQIDFIHNDLYVNPDNINEHTALVNAAFTNGTGSQEATDARLIYTPEGGSSQETISINFDGVNGTVYWNLIGLEPATKYTIYVEYLGLNNQVISTSPSVDFTTSYTEIKHGSLEADPASITQTTATINATFRNGTAFEKATDAKLTYRKRGSQYVERDVPSTTFNGLNGNASWNLASLDPGSEYQMFVEYYDSNDDVIFTSLPMYYFETADIVFNHVDLFAENITQTGATVETKFENGTGLQEATDVVLTYHTPTGPINTLPYRISPIEDSASWELTNLDPGKEYLISVEYFNGTTSLGEYPGTNFTTEAQSFVSKGIESIDTTNTGATVISNFENGREENEATLAILKYAPTDVPGLQQKKEYNILPGDTSTFFHITSGLKENTEYTALIEYKNSNGVVIGTEASFTFETKYNEFSHTSLQASNITETTATVTSTFANGSGPDVANKAELTYEPIGGTGTAQTVPHDEFIDNKATWNLTGLEEGVEYKISVTYYDVQDDPIGDSKYEGERFITKYTQLQTGEMNSEWVGTGLEVEVNGFQNGTGRDLATDYKIELINIEKPADVLQIEGQIFNGMSQISHVFTAAKEENKYKIRVTYSNSTFPEIGVIEGEYPLDNKALNIGLIAGISAGAAVLFGLLFRRAKVRK